MKKLSIISLAVFFFSLSASAQSLPVLNNRIDSLNFALGLLQGSQIAEHTSFDGTNEQFNAFMRGIESGMKVNPEHARLIGIGTEIGESLRTEVQEGTLMGISSLSVNFDLIKQGLINGMRGFERTMSAEEAQIYLHTVMPQLHQAQQNAAGEENRLAGEAFLAENAAREGVVVLPSGLQYRIITAGSGRRPTANEVVRVHYHGTFLDGTVFDSSIDRDDPAIFGVTQVIPGWIEALQLMPVGSTWMIYVPYHLAYGRHGAGQLIPPFATLIFEVRLLGIE